MKKLEISKSQARGFLVNYHGLSSYNRFKGEKGILEFISKVGCIQYDPLNVVGRNPDLVLQSRIHGYTADVLEKLLYTDRSLIDGWDKMMSIYKTEDWPFLHRVREQHVKSTLSTMNYRGTLEALEITDKVKDIIIKNGPVQASKINIGFVDKGRWGPRKLSSVALDYLYTRGELGILKKNNTQKIFDLIENLLDYELINKPDPFSSDREFYKWYVKRRIGSLGMVWRRNGGGWLGHFLSNKALRESIIDELLSEKDIIAITVKGIKEDFYVRVEDISYFDNIDDKSEKSTRFIAPLDNFLWDRSIIEEVFDFKYRWEVYTPKDKRKFGYYVLPVLYGDKFVARFEPEQHRGNSPLEIKNWWWEEDVIVTDEMKHSVNECLESFCKYLGADGLTVDSMNRIFA